MFGIATKLGRLRVFPTHDITCEFNHGDLHTQTDTQVRNFVFTGVLNRADLALHTTVTKTTRNQDGIDPGEHLDTFTLNVFGVDVTDVHFGAVVNASMINRFDQRLIGIQQVHVLTDHRDRHFFLWVELGVCHVIPFRQVGFFA